MKKAIVLGGTHDHIRLIEILKEKGYYVILIDYLDNPPAREYADQHIIESTLDKERVLDIAIKNQVDLTIALCIDQALLTMAYVCETLKLPCHISYQTALELTNKAFMKIKFTEHNIPTAKFIIQKNLVLDSITGLRLPLVVKPVDSNSSKGVSKADSKHDLEYAASIAFSHSRTKQIVIEEFIEGEEFSVDVAVKNGEPTVLLVTKNIKLQQNENTFTIVQSYFPATTDPTLLDKIHNIVQQIVAAYNITNSPLLVQLIHNNGELYVIEFSARLGGGSKHHLIKKITGFDLLEWFVDVIHSEPKSITTQQNYNYACINYIYTDNGRIGSFKGFEELVAEGVIDEYYFYKTTGTDIANHISSSDRLAGYLITAQDHLLLIKNIENAKRRVRVNDSFNKQLLIK